MYLNEAHYLRFTPWICPTNTGRRRSLSPTSGSGLPLVNLGLSPDRSPKSSFADVSYGRDPPSDSSRTPHLKSTPRSEPTPSSRRPIHSRSTSRSIESDRKDKGTLRKAGEQREDESSSSRQPEDKNTRLEMFPPEAKSKKKKSTLKSQKIHSSKKEKQQSEVGKTPKELKNKRDLKILIPQGPRGILSSFPYINESGHQPENSNDHPGSPSYRVNAEEDQNNEADVQDDIRVTNTDNEAGRVNNSMAASPFSGRNKHHKRVIIRTSPSSYAETQGLDGAHELEKFKYSPTGYDAAKHKHRSRLSPGMAERSPSISSRGTPSPQRSHPLSSRSSSENRGSSYPSPLESPAMSSGSTEGLSHRALVSSAGSSPARSRRNSKRDRKEGKDFAPDSKSKEKTNPLDGLRKWEQETVRRQQDKERLVMLIRNRCNSIAVKNFSYHHADKLIEDCKNLLSTVSNTSVSPAFLAYDCLAKLAFSGELTSFENVGRISSAVIGMAASVLNSTHVPARDEAEDSSAETRQPIVDPATTSDSFRISGKTRDNITRNVGKVTIKSATNITITSTKTPPTPHATLTSKSKSRMSPAHIKPSAQTAVPKSDKSEPENITDDSANLAKVEVLTIT